MSFWAVYLGIYGGSDAGAPAFLVAWAAGCNEVLVAEGGRMRKNTAGQKAGAQLISASDGSAFTGSVTAYVTGDAGTQALGSVGSGACTHEGNGYHTYAPAQAETNYDLIAFTFTGTGAIPVTVQILTTSLNPHDTVRAGLTALPNAAADAAGGLPISDAGGLDLDAQIGTKISDILVDTAEIGVAGAGLTNINLPNQTMDIVGNITGNLSGSVGSVTANVNAVLANTAHGGTSATLRLGTSGATPAFYVTSSGGTAARFSSSSERGLQLDSSAAQGLYIEGTANSIPAMAVLGTGTNGDALSLQSTSGYAITAGSGAGTVVSIAGSFTISGTLSVTTNSIPWNATWDAEVQSEVTDALNAYDPPTNTEMEARTLAAASYATASALDTVDNFLDTEIAAIKAKTDQLTFTTPNVVDASASVTLTQDDIDDIVAGVSAGLDVPTVAEIAAGLSGSEITVTNPVQPATQTLSLVAGDDYYTADGAVPTWTSTDWPDLTGATWVRITFRGPARTDVVLDCTTANEGEATQTVKLDPLPRTDTDDLTGYTGYKIRAKLANGREKTLVDNSVLSVS
jgi:hypothetical protein